MGQERFVSISTSPFCLWRDTPSPLPFLIQKLLNLITLLSRLTHGRVSSCTQQQADRQHDCYFLFPKCMYNVSFFSSFIFKGSTERDRVRHSHAYLLKLISPLACLFKSGSQLPHLSFIGLESFYFKDRLVR